MLAHDSRYRPLPKTSYMPEPETTQPFNRLLVANRGEIAIRIMRAATELHIRTVAIYTFEDRYSLHRFKADEAYQVGREDDPLKPYLNIEEIISLAKNKGIDAIHPGYGFLSENVTFAQRCREEGIQFIGPEPEVMTRLGDKKQAKAVAREVGVPVIEDSQVDLSDVTLAEQEAERIGYPVIIKAAAGGGGRGMRVVHSAEGLRQAFDEAKNEAGKAFGEDTVFIEKFIEQPKHLEVQILGDRYGKLVHLYERDCSVQRRFQKVVEVAPAPNVSNETKEKLYAYALTMGQHVGYSNAGTVEFLMDRHEELFFIEVNPRIQVEHTVTEMITDVDIVRSQILIAQGSPLSDPYINIEHGKKVNYHGYAIQCRITTEDPENNFQPDYGRVIAYRNAAGFGIRLDEGSSYPGVQISPFFDSLLVKVSAYGRSLKGASDRMHRALAEFRIRGVITNIAFLDNVISHPVFNQGAATVQFIDEHPELFNFRPGQDRGTRMLKYLADVIVNGNQDVKYTDPRKTFRTPTVPEYNPFETCPSGTKQKLEEWGPTGLAEWLKQQNTIQYTDTTFRDAHQSLLATRVRTIDMERVATSYAMHHPQTFSMEVWGGATFDVAMRFLKEDPWQRLQRLRKAIPNIMLQMLLRGSNAVGYTAYPDNLIEKFIEKAWETGIDVFRIFDSLNWVEAMKVSIQTVRNRTNAIAEACLCYTGDITDPSREKYDLQYYLDLAKQLEDQGAHILAIKDMAGLVKPYAAELLIGELKNTVSIPVHLHTHDTSSMQNATYLKAIEAGVDVVDVAIASMSGLTSQPNFNSLVYCMEANSERHQPFDKASLNEFSNYWRDVREYYYPFESDLKAGTAEVYEHEIPGGQYSNLGPQARAMGLDEHFETIKYNYQHVNQMFGDIVKVTPSSKVVGDMALFMTSNGYTPQDILDKGHEISFPDSVKSFFRGELGQPHGGFPSELQNIVLKGEQPFTDRPNAHLAPVDFDKELAEFREKYDEQRTFLDFLSYKLYPKVYDEFYRSQLAYGDVSRIPTPAFFFGLKNNEEILIEIDQGKTIIVQFLEISEPDDDGIRTVFLKLNGQNRNIEIKDENVESRRIKRPKAEAPNEIGAPLQGKLSRYLVSEGDAVEKQTPLFVFEAMKMESTVTAPHAGTVKKLHLAEGTMLGQGDLVIELKG